MLDSDLVRLAERASVLAAHLAADAARLLKALDDGESGYRSAQLARGSVGVHADPTFAAAAGGRDIARSARARLDVIVRDAAKLLEEANSIRTEWIEPVVFKRAQRDEGCESCARHGRHEDVLATGTVNDRLAKPMRLGRWCIDFVTAAGALPVDWQVLDHHDGKKVKRERAEPRGDLTATHTFKVVVTAHHPRNRLAEARGDLERALDRAGITADIRVSKPDKAGAA